MNKELSKEIDSILVDLNCDICGAQMRMTKLAGIPYTDFYFQCTKCEQNHSWGPMGHSMTILKNLWPSMPINKMSPKMQRDYIDAWRDKNMFSIRAELIGGLLTQDKYDIELNKIDTAVNEFWANNKTVSKKLNHWWLRLWK